MPAKYCPVSTCAAKNEYSIKPPKFCGTCGIEFAKAFMVVANNTKTAPITQTIEVKRVVKHRPPTEDNDQDSEESYDPNSVQEQAHEIIASMSPSDFGLILTPTKDGSVTLGSLFKNPEAYNVGQRTAESQLSAE